MFTYEAYGLYIYSQAEILILRKSEINFQGKPEIRILEKKNLDKDFNFNENSLDFSQSKFYRKDTGYFLIENGNTIYFQKTKGCSKEDFSRTLLHQVFARLLFQKKYLSIHAGCISINSKSFLFSGLSGSGKSTLTLKMLLKDRVKFISEDTTPLCIGQNNIKSITSFPFIKLDQELIDKSKFKNSPLINFERDRLNRKGFFLNEELLAPTLLNLKGCFFLEWGEKNEIKELEKNEIFPYLMANIFKPHSSPKDIECERFTLKSIGNFINSIKCFHFVRNKKNHKGSSDLIYEKILGMSESQER